MHKRVVVLSLSLLFLCALILTFVVAVDDPTEDIFNGTGMASELDRSSWNLSERGVDFDLYLINETNSTYYLELSSERINYYNGTEFEQINTTIVSNNCDYSYCVRKGGYFADFYNFYNQGGMVKFYYNGSEIIYTPISITYYNGSTEQVIANISTNVTGYNNGSTFLYPSIFGNGFDLKYTYGNNILKKDLIILDSSILPQPNLTGAVYLNINFVFNTSATINVGEEDENGSIVFSQLGEDTLENNISMIKGVDSQQSEGYYILIPSVFDSNESRQRITYTISSFTENNLISIVTPYSWLNDSSRVYPVTIDPDTSPENGNTDYFVWKHTYPNGTIAQWSYGRSTSTVPLLSTGNFWSLGQNRYKRAIVRYPISSTARNILASATSYEGFTVEIYDHFEYASSSDDDLQIGVVDEDYPRSLTPTTPRDLDDLFNKTDDISAGSNIWTNRIWLVTNPVVNAMNVIYNPAGTEGNAVINNVINNNEPFIIGLSGFQNAGVTNEVQYRGVAHSQDKPRISIRYTCTNRANICDVCLDQSNGASCDCRSECQGNYCWGNSASSATCASTCAVAGKYSPNGDSCCGNLQWNPTTKQCYDPTPSCPIPDGSRESCDCDNDNECPTGYYCYQREGYDPCLQRQFCNGTIQVKTFTSQNRAISGVKVYLSGNLNGTTNSGGFRDLIVNNVSCGASNNIEVKCSDNTLCGSGNVAIDYNGENDSIQFDCSLCQTDEDLFISQEDITTNFTEGSTNYLNVSVKVHSQNKNVNNLKVRFNLIGTDGLVKDTKTNTLNLVANTINSTTADLSSTSSVIYVTVQVDPDNQVSNDPKTNNFVRRVVFGRTKGYLDINTGFSEVNSKIREFMDPFVEPVSLSNAQIIYSVGRLSNYSQHLVNRQEQGCRIVDNQVRVDGIQLDNPYTGTICSFKNGTKTVVAAIGSDIDGDIAAVKKLGSAANVYFKGTAVKPRIVIDWNDLTAIGVYDFLHNSENFPYYHVNLPQFGNITEKILNGNTYDVAIRLVNTTNTNPTTLRIKNVNSDFSNDYKNALASGNTRPVVLSGGIFSDIEAWETDSKDGLANKLARDEGRDTWEIEMTGGPISENESALDYTYQNLVDDYWPAVVGAVQYYTGKITMDYVGHSNGCRVALSSLKSYQTTGKSNVAIVQNLQTGNNVNVNLQGGVGAPVVNTFVGVACPGTLNVETIFSSATRTNVVPGIGPKVGNAAMLLISNSHVTLREYGTKMLIVGALNPNVPVAVTFIISLFTENNKISRNLMDFYNDLSIEENSNFSLSGLNVSKVRLYYGKLTPLNGQDAVVPVEDMDNIYNQITSSNKDKDTFSFRHHSNVKDDPDLKQRILEDIRNG